MIPSIVCRNLSQKIILMITVFFAGLPATINEVAKPNDTPFHGKTGGLFVTSFPTNPQKGNFSFVYISFSNPRMNANVHT